MGVNIDQLTTEVIPEPEPAAPSAGVREEKMWDLIETTREAYSTMIRDHARTAAEAFDD